jgi:hypothetical protein|tara:strand:+ start:1068 stop:1382 length:315 start_codon:yes stop_codon:yes gene_type:complete
MNKSLTADFSFENQEECNFVIGFITNLMEESIRKGFFSRSNITFISIWEADFTISIFQEILHQRIVFKNKQFPIIQNFTLIGNEQVKFTITSEFYEFYLQNTAI